MTTIYNSSKGPKPIAEMPYPHLVAAYAKLLREAPHRLDELTAMAARIAELDAMPDDAARIAATQPTRVVRMGDNKPPVDTPFEAIKVHIDDLYAEAKGWLDGAAIATQAQADEVSKLRGMIKEAAKLADDQRKRENEPFDAGKAEVQARYAPLISDTKSIRGKTVLADEACAKALTPWLRQMEAEREEAAKRARDEAERIAREAREKLATATSLEDAETAESMFADAKLATREAKDLEADRARVGVGSGYRPTILKDNWTVRLTNGQEALRHYWTSNRQALEAFALQLAQADVRAGKRAIPGFEITNEKRAA